MRYLLVCVFAVTIVVGVMSARKADPPGPADPARGSVLERFQSLNRLSVDARQKGDEESLRAFTDSVVNEIVPPGPLSDSLKSQLFPLERKHRTTRDVCITEQSLARGLNSFVARIGAPDFARTSGLQIRVFRTQLHFMGLSDVVAPEISSRPTKSLGHRPGEPLASVSEKVGPAEAALVVATLVRSKLVNEAFQVAPEVWADSFLKQRAQARQDQAQGVDDRETVRPVHSLRALSPTSGSIALMFSWKSFARSVATSQDMENELNAFVTDIRNE